MPAEVSPNFKEPLRHLAIIMDGNGRWAEKHNWPRTVGHRKAENAVKQTVSFCLEKKVQALTLFAFSTENWRRPKAEIEFIMDLLAEFLDRAYDLLVDKKVRLHWLGEKNRLPEALRDKFLKLVDLTKDYTAMDLSFAVDYGSQLEIVQTAKKIAQAFAKREINLNDITESYFDHQLYTSHLPPVDLIIRTAGEYRLSNFLLWQAAYSELYFTNTLWPEFGEKDLRAAFDSYDRRHRTKGSVKPLKDYHPPI